MMKKRFLCCLCLAIFTAVSLFGFTACSNGSSYDDSALVDRIEALEDQITQQGETIKTQQDTLLGVFEDGEGRDGWIHIAPGIGENKNPERFPFILFEQEVGNFAAAPPRNP